jgi:hypothetical protein
VPCSKVIELKAGHRQLRNLETLGISPRLLDGTGDLLDCVVLKLLKNIKAGDHLVVEEGLGRPLAEKEDMIED